MSDEPHAFREGLALPEPLSPPAGAPADYWERLEAGESPEIGCPNCAALAAENHRLREARFALIVENEQLVTDLAACSERTVRLTDALQRAEQEARKWAGSHATCSICGGWADRPFGEVAVAIPHRPTCPFWVLTAAARAALENANG